MNGYSPRALRSIDIARRVLDRLARARLDSAVIGSVALAVHGYVRATRDLDLAVAAITFGGLRRVAEALRADGFRVHVGEPAPDDVLGGVVTVEGDDFDPIQIVNLIAPGGRHGKLARDAIASAQRVAELGLPVVDVPHLVALKLLAGSRKDELDVLELLGANPELPVEPIVEVCRRHRLGRRLEDLVRSNERR
jgi:hypothetical protein